jgi:hypothetical protein
VENLRVKRAGCTAGRVYIVIVILDRMQMSTAEFNERTGWELKPEGACQGDRCIPMQDLAIRDGNVDIGDFARRLGKPVAHDDKHGLWAIGPESGGRVLPSANFPEVVLPDFAGNQLDLATLRGRKVLLVAWASY